MSDQAVIKDKFERLRPAMDERMRRLWAANESMALGWGGIRLVAQATGLSPNTIRQGIADLNAPPTDLSAGAEDSQRIRRPGAGPKLAEVKDPGIVAALERLLADEVAGDPMSEQRWVRSSLRRLSEQLKKEGHEASAGTVRRLLKDMGFSLKANQRKQGRPGCPERDAQFQYIASQRQRFIAAGLPVISVDTKKKELIGEFRSNGKTWCRAAEEVHEHDFPGAAECRAVPFGIYDVTRNKGSVYVGVSNNTPEFAVHSIARWWEEERQRLYPGAGELLVLADGGGSNGCHVRGWKYHLQGKLCDAFGLTVTVCHYPTGCSKWNPVEHRLFSYISKNWAGKPLKTLGIMLGYIRGTSTNTGLTVQAFLDEGVYRKAQKWTRQDIERLALESHVVCPAWNYTLRPRSQLACEGLETP
ncbi:MAG TPA: ISAzo13 family transposase [Chloroflexota bacterium]